jgi:poly [ADP-ribose] polymerase
MKYTELNYVHHTPTGGKQDHVTLISRDNKTFQEIKGQIGITIGRNKPKINAYPISMWDTILDSYISRGYFVVPGKTAPASSKYITQGSTNTVEPNADAQELIDILYALAKHEAQQTFSFKVSDLTKEQIDKATEIFHIMSQTYKDISLDEFNNMLCQYFSIVPRRMRKVNDHLVKGRDDKGNKLSDDDINEEKGLKLQKEMDLFDTMLNILHGESMIDSNQSFCNEYGLNIRKADEKDEEYIKKKLGDDAGRFKKAWKVQNGNTEKLFNEFCEQNSLTDDNGGIAHLWHGSGSENLLSILISGILVNPHNALTGESPIICGKAYGLGKYFAPRAAKSLGYTKHGGNNTAVFLLLNKVAVGQKHTQYNGQLGINHELTWEGLQKIKPGAFCTWAEMQYSHFRNDEVIVYQDSQSTIEYLVQVE